jgi:hypothetical protein
MSMTAEDLQAKDSRASTLLFAEGDSWFNFPLGFDIVRELTLCGYAVKSIADPGHTLKFMATSQPQKAEFVAEIDALAKRGTVPKAILLSGGGNDFVDHFACFLNDYDPVLPTLRPEEVDKFLEQHLRVLFIEWLTFVTSSCIKAFEPAEPIPILVHGYAYVVPDGRPALIVGPWLKPEFAAKGYPSRVQNTRTMETLINDFNGMLSGLLQERPWNHVHYVDLRSTLSNDLTKCDGVRKYKHDWNDELHPTSDGFSRVAKEFVRAIDQL